MPLSQERRKQLDDIVVKMADQNAPKADVQSIVNDFTSKYGNEEFKASSQQNQQGLLKRVSQTAENVGKGIVKGVGSTITGASQLGQKTIGKIPEAIIGAFGGNLQLPQSIQAAEQLRQQRFTPSNTAQNIGFMGEQIGEAFIPGSKIAQGGKAIETASKISKLPGALKGAFNLASKAGLEALGSGAVTAAQTGGNVGETIKSGGLAAGLTPLGVGFNKIAQRIPENTWSSLLKRTPTEIQKRPGLESEAVKTGIFGVSRKSIAKQAQQNIQNLEVKMDDLLSGAAGTINGQVIGSYLDDIKNSYSNIPGEKTSVAIIDKIQKEMMTKGDLSLTEANKLKRNIYQVIEKSYGKGTMELPAKTESQKQVARGIKTEIEKVIPEIKDLNQQQGIYLNMKKAIDKSLTRTKGKGIAGTGLGLYDLMVGIGGGLAGSATGGITTGIVGGLALKKVAESPGFLTGVAKLAEHYNTLSPTQKELFYRGLQGLISTKGRVGEK